RSILANADATAPPSALSKTVLLRWRPYSSGRGRRICGRPAVSVLRETWRLRLTRNTSRGPWPRAGVSMPKTAQAAIQPRRAPNVHSPSATQHQNPPSLGFSGLETALFPPFFVIARPPGRAFPPNHRPTGFGKNFPPLPRRELPADWIRTEVMKDSGRGYYRN